MYHLAAREAKNQFGQLIDMAQHGPVTIEKKGRAVVVVVSMQEYKRLEEAEEALWIALAKEAEKEGMENSEESQKFLEEIRDAKD